MSPIPVDNRVSQSLVLLRGMMPYAGWNNSWGIRTTPRGHSLFCEALCAMKRRSTPNWRRMRSEAGEPLSISSQSDWEVSSATLRNCSPCYAPSLAAPHRRGELRERTFLPPCLSGSRVRNGSRHFVSDILRQGNSLALAATERAARQRSARQSDEGRSRLIRSPSHRREMVNKQCSKSSRGPGVCPDAPAGRPAGLFAVPARQANASAGGVVSPAKASPRSAWRAADLSGLRFRDCPIAEETLIGQTGHAYETLHRTLTVTKMLCGALALGAADTALRIVMDFAARRRLYGGTALDIPYVRAQLCGAFLDILLCESVAHAATRALSDRDEPCVFLAALVKYFVPTVVERVLQSLSVVLGARFFLRQGPEAYFQKIVRDAAIVSVFEGSTVVNLGILASQLMHRRVGKSGSAVWTIMTAGETLLSAWGPSANESVRLEPPNNERRRRRHRAP